MDSTILSEDFHELEEQPVSDTQQSAPSNPRLVDAQYVLFPPFSDWKAQVNGAQWDQFCVPLREYRQTAPELFGKAVRMVIRATAVETGAIENLYETDRGFTRTVAEESTSWEAEVALKGAEVMPLLEGQFSAYDYVQDMAAQQEPITEASIRKLHEVMCAGQEFVDVTTPNGRGKQPFLKGVYKSHPNHVELPNGSIHAYCPVLMVSQEMQRFCDELRSEAFEKAHPIIQVAYAHYAFVAIHPFADGNGRLARAIASIFTFRAESIPMMVFFDTRPDYFDALEEADQKRYQPFTDFVFERCLEGVQLAIAGFKAAKSNVESSVNRIKRVFTTKGGYSHQEIDQAGHEFSEKFKNEIAQRSTKLNQQNFWFEVRQAPNSVSMNWPGYRGVGNDIFLFQISSGIPYLVTQQNQLCSFVPVNPDSDGSVFLVNSMDLNEQYECRINEIIPKLKNATQIRIDFMVDQFLNKRLAEFADLLEQAKNKP
jgi:Fic family protein